MNFGEPKSSFTCCLGSGRVPFWQMPALKLTPRAAGSNPEPQPSDPGGGHPPQLSCLMSCRAEKSTGTEGPMVEVR